MPQIWPLSRQQVLDASGRPILIPRANFYAAGTTDPLEVYADPDRTIALPQPVEADGFGRFPRVYLPDGKYREEVVGAYGEVLWNDDGLGAAAVTTGGGTAPGTVDPNAIAATGDVKWRLDAGILPGWVRMNGRTIGGAGSGATELASVTASALFILLWNAFPDTIASVVGGRGTSATADFAAGKRITVPTMQGLVAGGLDDMGSSPAGRLQTIADLTLTAGSATATVASAARLAIGMTVIATGVSAGTVIADIAGTTLTLSQPAAAGSSGTVPARFSVIGDAQAPGQAGGDSIAGIATRNLPAAMPGGQVEVSYPSQTFVLYDSLTSASTGAGGGIVQNLWQGTKNAPTTPPNNSTFNVPIANPNGGVPVANQPPTRLGTFFMKL